MIHPFSGHEAAQPERQNGAEAGPRRPLLPARGRSAVTAVYRATGNLFLAQRFAWHASPITTIIYTHPSDEELAEGDRELRC